MDPSLDLLSQLWPKLVWPLIRLLFFISIGLLVANIIESLNWTTKIAAVSRPLIRLGHLSQRVGAAFSMAIISGVAANTMLAEAYDNNLINKRELVLANLFNSLPTYFLHLPTIIVITLPLIKGAAFIYVGITFTAALFRTASIVVISRFILPKPFEKTDVEVAPQKEMNWSAVFKKAWRRFKKRMRKIALFTVPIYIIIFMMNRYHLFSYLEELIANHLSGISWLSPQAMGIIALHLAAELTAGLAAAGALLQEGALSYREIVLALLVGNVLSSPLRAVRHQFPYYAGIFKPRLAIELIICNQAFRIFSLIFAGFIYFTLTSV
ncbi:MAG: hypothetical protein HKP41_19565 [Desulfobacterales bacterium]|nr:hypothetical protein [Desulfobacterales bacterium]